MGKLRFDQARQLKIQADCRWALATALEPTDHLTPPPETPATVVCKKKIQQGETPDRCCIIDNSYCPRKKETKA